MIDLEIIKQIESSGNPKAYNVKSKAHGLYQITPIVLTEWNNFHPKQIYASEDLFNPRVNLLIASWYMNLRIPDMLIHYKLPDTDVNRLWAYNAGIGKVLKTDLPKETTDYIKKYMMLKKGDS